MTRDEIIAKHGDYILASITLADMLQFCPGDVEFDADPTEEELREIAEHMEEMKPLFFMAIGAVASQAQAQAQMDGNLIQPPPPGFTV